MVSVDIYRAESGHYLVKAQEGQAWQGEWRTVLGFSVQPGQACNQVELDLLGGDKAYIAASVVRVHRQ